MSLSTSSGSSKTAPARRRGERVTLWLDEAVLKSLKQTAQSRGITVSQLVSSLVREDLESSSGTGYEALRQRIHQRRERLGPMPDSTPIVRSFRDRV